MQWAQFLPINIPMPNRKDIYEGQSLSTAIYVINDLMPASPTRITIVVHAGTYTENITCHERIDLIAQDGPVIIDGDVTMDSDALLIGPITILGAISGTPKAGTFTPQLLSFYGGTAVDRPDALSAQLTSITHTAPVTPDYALQNLVQNTGFGFATADEGNTLLSVVLNLQTRLAQVEARLEELNLITPN